MKPGILCVEKDPKLIQSLQSLRVNWDIFSTGDGSHAMELLSQRPFDVLVADHHVRGKEGTDLLTLAMNRYSGTLRLMTFDLGNKESSKSSGAAHQCLSRPYTAETLMMAVDRARMLRTWMADSAITRLLGLIKKLPSLPAIYLRLMQALESPDTSIEEIGRIIAQDMVMTARILQLVNSAYFGLQSNLTNPAEAITYLGINQTKALVLMAHVFSNFEETKTSFFSFDSLWRHSISTGKLAGWITRDETGNCKLAEESFTAGVLHDVGKLMLAVNVPDEYSTVAEEARQKRSTFDVAERQILGTTHAELGACILGSWGLPFDLVQAIAFHHTPMLHDGKSFSSVTAVHLANVLEHEVQANEEEAFRPKFDLDYLARLHLEHLPKVWREIVGSTIK